MRFSLLLIDFMSLSIGIVLIQARFYSGKKLCNYNRYWCNVKLKILFVQGANLRFHCAHLSITFKPPPLHHLPFRHILTIHSQLQNIGSRLHASQIQFFLWVLEVFLQNKIPAEVIQMQHMTALLHKLALCTDVNLLFSWVGKKLKCIAIHLIRHGE